VRWNVFRILYMLGTCMGAQSCRYRWSTQRAMRNLQRLFFLSGLGLGWGADEACCRSHADPRCIVHDVKQHAHYTMIGAVRLRCIV